MPEDSRGGSDRVRSLESGLIARSQKGDTRAFNQLVEMYQSGAYALALRMLGDPEAAADVTQDAFFSAFRAINSFKGASFRAWLLRIVSNGCYDYWRAQGRRPATSLEAVLEDDRDGEAVGQGSDVRLPRAMIDPSWDPERVALKAEMIEQIQAALLQLAPEQRLAVILSDVQGMPYEEIARVMNTSLGTVKSRIARARTHLRGILVRQGELFRGTGRPDGGQTFT
ncbi:MAG TPA: sigma-70 family RNA polymerase sigma factor [Ktedonobacterales bacterium]|nr:sigma-70 family RNA polymerase sigma factor [Ktedonobacterales bacterium]